MRGEQVRAADPGGEPLEGLVNLGLCFADRAFHFYPEGLPRRKNAKMSAIPATLNRAHYSPRQFGLNCSLRPRRVCAVLHSPRSYIVRTLGAVRWVPRQALYSEGGKIPSGYAVTRPESGFPFLG